MVLKTILPQATNWRNNKIQDDWQDSLEAKVRTERKWKKGEDGKWNRAAKQRGRIRVFNPAICSSASAGPRTRHSCMEEPVAFACASTMLCLRHWRWEIGSVLTNERRAAANAWTPRSRSSMWLCGGSESRAFNPKDSAGDSRLGCEDPVRCEDPEHVVAVWMRLQTARWPCHRLSPIPPFVRSSPICKFRS